MFLHNPKTKKFLINPFVLPLILFCFFSTANYAQSDNYIQNWTMIGESETFVDISYSVVQCDENVQKILLQVFNESGTVQKANFTVTISDENSGKSVEHKFEDLELSVGEMCQPECGNNKFANLRFDVPENYDSSRMSVSVNFN